MGESSAAAPTTTPKIDTAVGTIVWVRRRNGSWWPGRILGVEELSATHLMSPRSGTPVKLLGRDDASVDWYNIEKSKRVKAFRCGEYDDCIEKAKAYANLPAKKVVKYARREDAILHALELEKKQLIHKQHSSSLEAVFSDEKKHGSETKQSRLHVPGLQKDRREHKSVEHNDILEPDSPLDAMQSVVSFQQTNPLSAAASLSVQNFKLTSEADLEDDSTEGTTRMRGLQDFGLRIAPKRKQPNMPTSREGIPKVVLPENIVRSPSYVARSIGCGSPVNCSKGSSLTLKKKRPQVGPVQENFTKRRDRRRPLTKVLENSTKLPVSSVSDYDYSVIESVHKGAMESEVGILQSKQVKESSLSALPRNSSDYTGTSLEREISLPTSPHVFETINGDFRSISMITDNACSNLSEYMDVNCCDQSYLHLDFHMEKNALTDFTPVLSSSTSKRFRTGMVGRYPGRAVEGQLSLMSKEGLDETGFSSFLRQSDSVEQSMGITDRRVSKWQSKGKRNARSLNKKHSESSNARSMVETGDTCTASMYLMALEDKAYSRKELRTKKIIGNSYDEPVSSLKDEQELNRCIFPDAFLQDGCRQSNMLISNDRKQPRTGNSAPTTKAEAQDLHCLAEIDQYTLERTGGSFSNDNSQAMSPSEEKSTKLEPSLSHEKLLRNKWCQIDAQGLWQQTMFTEGLDSGTSSGVMIDEPMSTGVTQYKVSNGKRIPNKLGMLAAEDLNESVLFDVPVDVQTTYQGEHVPLVSLMSRLNGKAIVGHPVTVETVEYGYCDAYLPHDLMNDSFVNYQTCSADEVGKNVVQPPWRTARRTDMQRVPRCCPSNKGNGNCNSSQHLGSQNGQSVVKAGYSDLHDKSRYIRKHPLHRLLPSVDKKSSKKLMKRGGLSSKKTRTLSSIAVEHESKYVNGGLRPLKLAEAPLVTCIPLKLVFSRIKEAVGNSPKSGNCGLTSSG